MPMMGMATISSIPIGGTAFDIEKMIRKFDRSVGELFLREQVPAAAGYGATGDMNVSQPQRR